MARLINRTLHLQGLAQMLGGREAIAAATADIDPTVQLSDWLKRLGRLHGLPYRYMVPNDRFLPDESIRFFQLDFNWIYALIEGACSIGHAGQTDAVQHAITRWKLHDTAQIEAAGAAPGSVTGFLLRSQIVPGWPRLEILPFDDKGVELVDVVRRELLSPSILLFMVAGTIDHVIIREPSIGLHSGIDIDGGKPLRYVTVPKAAPPGTSPGDQIAGVSAPVGFRPGGQRVLRLGALAERIQDLLSKNDANEGPDGKPLPFTSAEFALEMIEGTQAVTFRVGAAAGE
ncbi:MULTISPECIES: hypothetical protein [unclassified Brevundimonas]|uniref:hypothetical protein n=1 Tax=unclassified Brevundimonas TaxID=2622653 RepID=UPI003F8E5D7F